MWDFSARAIKKRDANLFAFLFSLAILGLVSWLVFLFIGDRKLGSGMRGKHLDTISLVVFLVFAAGATALYLAKRFGIMAGYKNGVFMIRVEDPSLAEPLVIRDPYTLNMQWQHLENGRRVKMKMLYITVCNEKGELLVTLRGAIGAIYSVPKEFEFIDRARPVMADLSYDVGQVKELGGVLHRHLEKLKKQAAL
jgi:hypothetical protein